MRFKPYGLSFHGKTQFFRLLLASCAVALRFAFFQGQNALKKRAGEGMGAREEGLQERLSFGKAGPSRTGRGVSLPLE